MKHVTFLITIALMAGCRMVPVPEEATSVPQARLLGFTKKSDAQLVVLGAHSLANGCTLRVSIDGKPAADLVTAEIAHFGLTMGSHRLSVYTSQECSKYWAKEVMISVKSGDALIMRIDKAGFTPVEL